LKQSFEHRCSP